MWDKETQCSVKGEIKNQDIDLIFFIWLYLNGV